MAEIKSDINVLALVGSLRAESINRKIAELAAADAPDGVTVTVFEGLNEVPFYNEEIDDTMNPEAPALAPVAALRAAAADADAALVVTPEYNGGIPAVIKNAIDWLSRPFGNGALKDKPLAVIGGSMGQYGGGWRRSNSPCRSERWKARLPRNTPSWWRMCVTLSASSPPRSAEFSGSQQVARWRPALFAEGNSQSRQIGLAALLAERGRAVGTGPVGGRCYTGVHGHSLRNL
jgi:NAD(P)H-dependent FMN reductase